MTTITIRSRAVSRFAAAVVVVLSASGLAVPAAAEEACSATKAIQQYDEMMRGNGQVALLEMRVVRPQTTRTLRMRFWFQTGRAGGDDRALARVEAPAAERGVASLRLGTKMWSFVPSTGRVQQVPESMMLGSWMGSDWTNDDVVRETSLLDDYRVTSSTSIDHEGPACQMTLEPRTGREVTWPRLVFVSRRGGEDDLMPLREEFYSRRAGELVLARVMTFSAFQVMGGRRVPSLMALEPVGRAGQRTEMRYLSLEFDTTIPDDVFSLNNLQRGR
jgi:hypothetical protein